MNEIIIGDLVVLRPASINERRLIFEWLALSDIAGLMSGPPTFPERPVPTWEQFQEDYLEYYFNDSALLLGRCYLIEVDGISIGQINYNDIEVFDGVTRVELDLWMRSKEHCGKGYGTDALNTLCQFLAERMWVQEFMVQPSARNPVAIRAYEKAGFKQLNVSMAVARDLWGPCDYQDGIHMVKRIFERKP